MTNTTLKSLAIAASSFALLGLNQAYAGADGARAEAYFNAISGGNAETIASFYADDAEFHWVGGPLAGTYKGKDKIKAVWEKFSKAAGELDHEVLQLSESANGKTATVTARVKFKGEGEVPVKFVMVYKDGKIASEVWQVDKANATYAKAEPKADGKAEPKAPVKADAKAEPKPDANAEPKLADATPVPSEAKPAAAQPQREARNAPPAPEADEAEGPEAEDLADAPEGAEAPAEEEVEAGAPPAPPVPAKKAEVTPDKDLKPEPKLGGGEPKLKTPDTKKKGAYVEKPEGYGFEKKAYKSKKPYYGEGYDDYGYGQRGYGHHGYGGYSGYGGWGHGGYGGYGRGGYGHY